MSEAFYEPLGDGRFRSTAHTGGPWDPRVQHAGPPAALLGRALERCAPRDGFVLARLTFEILGPVPVAEVEVAAAVVRPGRSVELLEGELRAGGRAGDDARARGGVKATGRRRRRPTRRRHRARPSRRRRRRARRASATATRSSCASRRRLAGARPGDGLDAPEGAVVAGEAPTAAPARARGRRLRQRRLGRPELGRVALHQPRALGALPAASRAASGSARRRDDDRRRAARVSRAACSPTRRRRRLRRPVAARRPPPRALSVELLGLTLSNSTLGLDKNVCQCFDAWRVRRRGDRGPRRRGRRAGPGAGAAALRAGRAGVGRDARGPGRADPPEGELPPARAGSPRPRDRRRGASAGAA